MKFAKQSDTTSLIFKLILVALAIIILGLPLNNLYKAMVFVVFCLILWSAQLSMPKKKGFIILFIIGALLLINYFVPTLAIQEGENLYLPTSSAPTYTYTALPKQIKNYLHSSFLKTYPEKTWCSKNKLGCWRYQVYSPALINHTYSTSANAFWQTPEYTRIINNIDFKSPSTLRAGFLNRLNTNWFSYVSHVSRDRMPYFVQYKIPESLVGSSICWKDTIFWPSASNRYTKIVAPGKRRCREILPQDVGHSIFGINMNPSKHLSIKLKKTFELSLFAIIHHSLPTIVLILLLSLFSYPDKKNLGLNLLVLLITPLIFIHWQHVIPYNFEIKFDASLDGLTYRGLSLQIMDALKQGHLMKALEGGSSIFNFMPGMRYFQLFDAIIFGQTQLGLLVVFLTFYLALFNLFRLFYPTIIAFILFYLMALVIRFNVISFPGYADPIATCLIFTGVFLLIKGLGLNSKMINLKLIWLSSLLFGVNIFLRPNFLIGIGFGSLIAFAYLLRKKHFIPVLLSLSGLLLSAAPLLHNIYFGHKPVLFVSSAYIPENFKMTPSLYWHGIAYLFTGAGKASYLQMMRHLTNWLSLNNTALACVRLIILFMLVGIATMPSYFLKWIPATHQKVVYLMTWMSIGFQIPLLFWNSVSRYSWPAWWLSGFCCAYVLYCAITSLWGRRASNVRIVHANKT